MSVSSEPLPPNRLIHETSPYLLQHAHIGFGIEIVGPVQRRRRRQQAQVQDLTSAQAALQPQHGQAPGQCGDCIDYLVTRIISFDEGLSLETEGSFFICRVGLNV